jgi:hypothetical protein
VLFIRKIGGKESGWADTIAIGHQGELGTYRLKPGNQTRFVIQCKKEKCEEGVAREGKDEGGSVEEEKEKEKFDQLNSSFLLFVENGI